VSTSQIGSTMAGRASVADVPNDIHDEYEVGETLGTGHFSKVKLGIHKITRERVAIKIIQKPAESKMGMLKAEVDILTKCDHPNIVRLYKVVDTEKVLYLVMEELKGGELFDRIIAKNHYTEAEARKLTITMLKAIKYLHEQGVAHRDLKPENILLKDTSEDAEIKITDFGLSKIFSSDLEGEVTMKTACGTPGYVAPEVLMHDVYSSQVDLWSVGVIVYILLCGFPPFYGDNDNQMFRKIKAGQYKFLSPYWDPISADAKEFVSKLLTVDWQKRMDAQQALDHRWLKDGKQASTHNLFEGNAMAMSRNTPPNPDSPKEVEAEPMEGEGAGMKDIFADYQLDRQLDRATSNINRLRETFGLPSDSERLGKFKCAYSGQAGILHVTTYHLCFLGAKARKMTIPYGDITTVGMQAKKGGLKALLPFAAPAISLNVGLKNNGSATFTGIVEKDACLKTIVAAAKERGVTLG